MDAATQRKLSISQANETDLNDWLPLRQALWGEETEPKRLKETMRELVRRGDRYCIFLARGPAGKALGFAEASLRLDYVNGCETSPVAFLEGIFVVPDARRGGCARQLVEAVTAWAMARGVSELAADVTIDNLVSQQMHEALGFQETERVVYFKKTL
ncbi:aminoglycoside 6'-N-acetyltransferase [Rhizobium halophytocola]|uniref:Aminoglycoside N(6')-acetyltransferase type 1 n=1 Tax=Rhizobium halophytocola TaxID=735519 RepID=A0ABS4E631_9HYPH|nr:aminoglycoside 6'-N-acetyltransferase [Rhizobium halophytocola]MBP1853378.1 aminoglycoside 6'-N-acetyltransferase I [Rhizobium halophytocola]